MTESHLSPGSTALTMATRGKPGGDHASTQSGAQSMTPSLPHYLISANDLLHRSTPTGDGQIGASVEVSGGNMTSEGARSSMHSSSCAASGTACTRSGNAWPGEDADFAPISLESEEAILQIERYGAAYYSGASLQFLRDVGRSSSQLRPNLTGAKASSTSANVSALEPILSATSLEQELLDTSCRAGSMSSSATSECDGPRNKSSSPVGIKSHSPVMRALSPAKTGTACSDNRKNTSSAKSLGGQHKVDKVDNVRKATGEYVTSGAAAIEQRYAAIFHYRRPEKMATWVVLSKTFYSFFFLCTCLHCAWLSLYSSYARTGTNFIQVDTPPAEPLPWVSRCFLV